ncbi:ferredoxin [Kribbella sp. NBC_01245]|uniref:ferredoxin n=1 Tax=Kribbella sp. NBC_01245 TaxID=2903578 RepID=UPI002E2B74E5|nr:ferredoxin [Kribbella sp. NBC_01245]
MDVTIDQDGCVGAGQCVLAAPGVFDQRDFDGVAFILKEPDPDQHDATRDAALHCPAQAIQLLE